MTIAKLVECTDRDVIYGILRVENADANEVQKKIYEIKNRFYEEDNDCWTVEDVLDNFPNEWNWSYEECVDEIEI